MASHGAAAAAGSDAVPAEVRDVTRLVIFCGKFGRWFGSS